jgi:hypothetical protein
LGGESRNRGQAELLSSVNVAIASGKLPLRGARTHCSTRGVLGPRRQRVGKVRATRGRVIFLSQWSLPKLNPECDLQFPTLLIHVSRWRRPPRPNGIQKPVECPGKRSRTAKRTISSFKSSMSWSVMPGYLRSVAKGQIVHAVPDLFEAAALPDPHVLLPLSPFPNTARSLIEG